MALPSFTITGTLLDLLGNTALGEIVGNGLGGATPATVTFTSNVPAGYFVTFDGAAYRVDEVTAEINSDGTITRNGEVVLLLANDDGLSVDGVQWQAHITGMKRFWFNAPVDGGTVDLDSVVPVPGLGVSGVAFSAGELVTLLADSGSSVREALDALYAAIGTGGDEYHEYANLAAFPGTGVADRIYVALDTGKFYRWTGSAYQLTSDTDVAAVTHAATGKTTPVDADELPLSDSAASFVLKKLTWANVKATLKTYLDTLYQPIAAKLTTLAGQTWAADTLTYQTSTSALATTPLTAAARALIDDATVAAQRVTLGVTGVTPLERYNPDTDFAAALTAAINASDADGSIVQFERGKTYTAAGSITTTDKHVRIDFNGAKFLRGTAAPNLVLSINYSHSTIQSVVGVTTNTFTPSWPTTMAVNSKVSRIEVASASGWAAGDYAVIVSDDNMPWWDGADSTTAERFQVSAVVGNYIYANGVLRVPLTTNIRIARMTKKDCILKDPWFEDQTPIATTRNESTQVLAFAEIQGAVAPTVTNLRVENLFGRGIRFLGGLDVRVVGGEVRNLRTVGASSAYGYGVEMCACTDYRISRMDGAYARHFVTTNGIDGVRVSGFAPTRNNLHNYGGCVGGRVYGSSGSGAGNTAYDMHSDAYQTVVDGCFVENTHVEPEATPFAFQLRGHMTEVRNCTSIGIAGACLWGTASGSYAHVQRLSNYQHTLLPTDTTSVGIKVDNTGMSVRPTAELDNVKLIAMQNKTYPFFFKNAVVKGKRIDLRAESTAGGSYWQFNLVNTALTIDTLVVDMTGTDGNGFSLFLFNDTTTTVVVDRLVVKGGAAWSLADFASYNGGSVKIGRLETDTMPITAVVESAGATSAWSIGEIVFNGQRIPRTTSITSSATPTINTDRCDQFNIIAQAAAITSMTTNLSGTPSGGQKLLIRITGDATPRAITWGASFVSSGAATLLATTAASKTHEVFLKYNSTAAKWVCLAVDATGY